MRRDGVCSMREAFSRVRPEEGGRWFCGKNCKAVRRIGWGMEIRLRLQVRDHRCTTILADTGRTRESLRKTRLEIQQEGWTGMIANLRQKLQARLTEKNRPKKERGQPRTKTMGTDISPKKLGGEPTIALVSLVCGPDVQFTVFAARHHSAPRTGVESLLKTIREACDRPMRPDWSRGYVDHHISEPLRVLKSSLLQLQNLKPKPSAKSLRITPLVKRFSDGWKFLILHSPGCKKSRTFKSLFDGTEHPTIECNGTLIDYLEAVLYTLRVTQNLRGLVPSLPSFRDVVRDYRQNALRHPFQWHAEESELLSEVQKRASDFFLRAANGYMLDLTSHIRNRIPNEEQFRATRFPAPIQVVAKPTPDGRIKGVVTPFPEFYTPIDMPGDQGQKWLGAPVKKFFRQNQDFSAFDYVVRPDRSQRTNIRFPDEFLVSPSKLKKLPLSVAVISLPRQFLMPLSEIPIIQMQQIAEKYPESNGVSRYDRGGESFLLFQAPKLTDAIYRAFVNNKYGRRVRDINEIEVSYRWKLWGPFYSIRHPQFPKPNRFGLRVGEWVFEPFDPPFFPSQRTQPEKGELNVISGFALSESGLPLGRYASRVVNYFRDIYGENDPFVLMLASEAAKIRKIRMVNQAMPGYEEREVLSYLYKAFDADFLLQEVDRKDWVELTELARKWRHAVRLEICKTLFPGSSIETVEPNGKSHDLSAVFANCSLDRYGVLRYLPSQLRSRAQKNLDSIQSWVFEGLEEFEKSGRVLRNALEVAQQFVIEGLEPKAMVVRTSASILRSWRAYFALFLRGKLEQEIVGAQPPFEGVTENQRATKNDRPISSVGGTEVAFGEADLPFNEETVSEICDVVEKLAQHGSTPVLLKTFAELARDGLADDWLEAVRRNNDNLKSKKISSWIKPSLEAFRSPEGDSPETHQRIADNLELARRSARSRGKKH